MPVSASGETFRKKQLRPSGVSIWFTTRGQRESDELRWEGENDRKVCDLGELERSVFGFYEDWNDTRENGVGRKMWEKGTDADAGETRWSEMCQFLSRVFLLLFFPRDRCIMGDANPWCLWNTFRSIGVSFSWVMGETREWINTTLSGDTVGGTGRNREGTGVYMAPKCLRHNMSEPVHYYYRLKSYTSPRVLLMARVNSERNTHHDFQIKQIRTFFGPIVVTRLTADLVVCLSN